VPTGERLVAVGFALMGALWAWKASDLPYMDDFAPGAGFLPFWLGLILVGLAGLVLVVGRSEAAPRRAPAAAPDMPAGTPGHPGSGRKVAAVAAGLLACIALIQPLGIAVPLAAYLFYLIRVVERRGLSLAIAVALGTSLGIVVVFGRWLSVPLPRGPWGF
jgi:putative tricarboxylic transport membrane protein